MPLRDASLELAHKRAGALPVACHHVAIDELAESAGVPRVEHAHALKACARPLEALERKENGAARLQRVAIALIKRERAVIGGNRFGVSPQQRQRIAAVEMQLSEIALERDGLIVASERLLEAPQIMQGRAAVGPGLDLTGVAGQ